MMSTYENELFAIVSVVLRWRLYLQGQKLGTPLQQKWVSKLMGYDFIVKYKKGAENRVVDALSRKGKEEEGTLMLITFPTVDWIEKLKATYAIDQQIHTLNSLLQENKLSSDYELRASLLRYITSCLFLTRKSSNISFYN